MNALKGMTSEQMDRSFLVHDVEYAVYEFFATAKWLMTTDDVAEMPVMIRWVEAAEKRMGIMCRPVGVVEAAKARLSLMVALGLTPDE